MNAAKHLSEDDLALLALQLLPVDEMQEAFLHIQQCEFCRNEVGKYQGDLALYALTTEMHTPSAQAREGLLRRVAMETRSSQSPAEVRSVPTASQDTEAIPAGGRGRVLPMERRYTERRPRAGWVSWAGWALAAGLAVTAGLQFQDRASLQDKLTFTQAQFASLKESTSQSQAALSTLTDPAALNVTLRQPTTKGGATPETPTGYAAYLPDRGALVFVATNLEPLKPYKVYELWLLPAEPNLSPIPAGSFRPDAAGNANVILPTGPKFVSVKGFGVTIEDDKSTPRKPTLPILLVGNSKT